MTLGRPPGPNPRRHTVTVRLTDAEFRTLLAKAHASGQTSTGYAQALLVDAIDRARAGTKLSGR